MLERLPGRVVFHVEGRGALETFEGEAGGHRWQRIPPTEKRGRVHTSTITVAVLPEPTESVLRIPSHELHVTTTRGSGPGGQHRNKVETCVTAKHLPTGIVVRCEEERSQGRNRELALRFLRARVAAAAADEALDDRARARRAQVGSGMRGDKRRTIRVRDGKVVDHVDGRRWRLRDYVRGDW